MTHHVHIRKDPNWAIGTPWATSELDALDAALVASVNGDGGGTYAPSGNVDIGGAGMRFIGTTHTLSGVHSSFTTNIGDSALLIHNDSDYCVLGPGHTGASLTTLSPVGGATPRGAPPPGQSLGTASGLWQLIAGLGPPGPCIVSGSVGAVARVPLRVHNGASFSGATFSFQVQGPSTTPIPTVLPRFGIFAQDMFGDIFPLCAATPYVQVPVPANTSLWTDTNQTQTLAFTCDAVSDNPYCLVDTTQYSYFAAIADCSGTSAVAGGVAYLDVLSSFTNILDIRPR